MRYLLICAWFVAVCSFANGQAKPAAETDAATAPNSSKPTSVIVIKRSVSAAMRQEAIARKTVAVSDSGAVNSEYADVVLRMCDLQAEIRGDERFLDSPMLQKSFHSLRSRLTDVAKSLEQQLAEVDIERPSWISATATRLRQRRGGSAPANGLVNDATQSDREGSTEDNQPTNGGAPGGGAMDNGWQLVELIQQTICPDFWDTNGGPGTIYYYALKRALVVRATSEIHGTVGNVLGQLQRN